MSSSWYIVQSVSGFEKKVAQTILEKAQSEGLVDYVEQVTVPIEEIIEVKKGKKVTTERKLYPGYVLVKMKMNERTWHMIRSIPKVNGFLGGSGKPQAISESEANKIFKQMEEASERPRSLVMFDLGDSVKIKEGPFESFTGVVEGVDEEKGKLKISVSIFGRSTPVELEFSQVEKT